MHINAPVIAVVAKFMTASAVAVNAPARNEKENTSQAPALSEVQSSRRVGGSPAKESPARHVSRPPARGCPVYKESAGAAAGPGREQSSRAPTAGAGHVSPLGHREHGAAGRALRDTERGRRGASHPGPGPPRGQPAPRARSRPCCSRRARPRGAGQGGLQRGSLRAVLCLLGPSGRPRCWCDRAALPARPGRAGLCSRHGPVATGKARHGRKRKFRELTKLTFFLDF